MANRKYVYIACPAYVKTGGTEVIHQLFYKLNKFKNLNVFLFYYNTDHKIEAPPTPPSFLKYIDNEKIISYLEDNETTNLVLPEVATNLILRYKKSKLFLWWLSVNNFYSSLGIDDFNNLTLKQKLKRLINKTPFDLIEIIFSKKIFLHLCQSQYSFDHLTQIGVENKIFLSDFINTNFFLNDDEVKNLKRSDVILYNPLKGYNVTQLAISNAKKFHFKPLVRMSNEEVKKEMMNSKIYIDLGNHPGKDRLPRESVLCGCCIVTNRRGSAGNNYDIAIPEIYKIDDRKFEVARFNELLESILLNFDYHVLNFSKYRQKIIDEEKIFDMEILNLSKYFY